MPVVGRTQGRDLTGMIRITWPEATIFKVPDVRRHFTVLHNPGDSCLSFGLSHCKTTLISKMTLDVPLV